MGGAECPGRGVGAADCTRDDGCDGRGEGCRSIVFFIACMYSAEGRFSKILRAASMISRLGDDATDSDDEHPDDDSPSFRRSLMIPLVSECMPSACCPCRKDRAGERSP